MRPVILFLFLAAVILLNSLRDTNKGNYILLLVAVFVGLVTALAIDFKCLVHIFVNITTEEGSFDDS